jgi:hypothetical protein
MGAFERFLGDNPAMAERPYGDAMAATLMQSTMRKIGDAPKKRKGLIPPRLPV